MPRKIDERVWDIVKTAYLGRHPKPSYAALSKEFNVSKASIEAYASKHGWAAERKRLDARAEEASEETIVKLARERPIQSSLDVLNGAISELYFEGLAIEGKSKEGCLNAMANLIKAKRDLYPPSLREIVAIAIGQGFSPDDFLAELRKQWSEQLVVNKPSGGPVQRKA